MLGKLLDRRGRIEGESTVAMLERRLRGAKTPEDEDALEAIISNMKKGWAVRGPFEPRGSLQTWEEVLYATIADGTQVLNSTTETIMVPDYTVPANYLYQGRVLHYILFFDTSTVITTPGTITMRLRWGGVTGTVLCLSGAYAPDPTAASSATMGYAEYFMVCRSVGTSGSATTMGRMWLSDHDDASATTLAGNLNLHALPSSGGAGAVTIDTTTAKALSPTVQFSVATATTQLTNHIALLETLT